MRCPFCLEDETQVKDSRATEENTAIRRRRLCPKCGGRFTTFERQQVRDLKVLKNDGSEQLFDRDKLSRSITIACHRRDVTTDQISKMVSSIVRQLELKGENMVKTNTIGSTVMESLRTVDAVAYVRYASVYRNFENPAEFVNFININTDDT